MLLGLLRGWGEAMHGKVLESQPTVPLPTGDLVMQVSFTLAGYNVEDNQVSP